MSGAAGPWLGQNWRSSLTAEQSAALGQRLFRALRRTPSHHLKTGPMDQQSRPRHFKLCLAGLLITSAMAALDSFIVNPALPQIMGEFGALTQLSWVITAFMLASTVSMPLYGKFSDMYGRRNLLVIAVIVFLIGSALCGLAQSLTQLIGFRAIQGLGAGGVGVLGMTALGDLVSPRDRPRYQGLFTATFALSNIAGPVVGGAITQWFGWRWIFYINLPIGIIALGIILYAFPRHTAERKSHKIDVMGMALLLSGTVSFLLVLSRVEAGGSLLAASFIGMAVLAVASFAALYRVEQRAAEPILAVQLLGNRVFSRTVLCSSLIGLAYFGSSVYLPLFFQLVGGMNVVESGLMLLPHLLASTAMSLGYGQIVARTGRYKPPILAGMALVSTALFGLVVTTHFELGYVAWIFCLMCMGTGGGLCMPNLTVAMQNSIPNRQLGLGTSTLQFCNQLAAVAGVAIAGLLLASLFRSGARRYVPEGLMDDMLKSGVQLLNTLPPGQKAQVVHVYEQAFIWIFLISAGLAVIAALVATRIPVLELRRTRDDAEPALT